MSQDDPSFPPSFEGSGAEHALRVEHLVKRYDDAVAVRNLSFTVARGEILGLVGPNGAGKTTTLRTIAGVLPIQEGRIQVAGFDLEKDEVKAKRSLSWVPDDPQPFDTLTVAEHLEFTARLYGMKGDWRARADQLIDTFELTEKRDALGGELSRGMRQKLAYCCGWLPQPAVSLLDEPLSGLDPRGIRSAREAIREMARGGSAVILSSHQLELIEALADRILVVDRGAKVFEGTLDEAREQMGRTGSGSSLEEIFLAITEERSLAPKAAGRPEAAPTPLEEAPPEEARPEEARAAEARAAEAPAEKAPAERTPAEEKRAAAGEGAPEAVPSDGSLEE